MGVCFFLFFWSKRTKISQYLVIFSCVVACGCFGSKGGFLRSVGPFRHTGTHFEISLKAALISLISLFWASLETNLTSSVSCSTLIIVVGYFWSLYGLD